MKQFRVKSTGQRGHGIRTHYLIRAAITIVLCAAIISPVFIFFNSKSTQTEEEKVTDVYITKKLSEISEMSTYAYQYTNKKEISNTREIFGIKIPFTTNRVNITYKGIIKAGYNMDEIETKVNNKSKNISVKLPKAQVFDNYILHDETKIEEENNIFNPVHVDSATKYFSEITAQELDKAKSLGLLTKAENKAKSIITNLFTEFPDYKVSFV